MRITCDEVVDVKDLFISSPISTEKEPEADSFSNIVITVYSCGKLRLSLNLKCVPCSQKSEKEIGVWKQ
jgi:hypothetical protein